MALNKLADELQETIRQTRDMAADMQTVLSALTDNALPDTEARDLAVRRLVVGLQAQDRIEQRCSNIQKVIREMARHTGQNDNYNAKNAKLWKELTLDELVSPEETGAARRASFGEVELF